MRGSTCQLRKPNFRSLHRTSHDAVFFVLQPVQGQNRKQVSKASVPDGVPAGSTCRLNYKYQVWARLRVSHLPGFHAARFMQPACLARFLSRAQDKVSENLSTPLNLHLRVIVCLRCCLWRKQEGFGSNMAKCKYQACAAYISQLCCCAEVKSQHGIFFLNLLFRNPRPKRLRSLRTPCPTMIDNAQCCFAPAGIQYPFQHLDIYNLSDGTLMRCGRYGL